MSEIVTIHKKKDEKFLRQKTREVDFHNLKKLNLRALVKDMRSIMRRADGVGLSANQIGLEMKLFVAEIPADQGEGKSKFYAVVNPEIVKLGNNMAEMEEGCLSVPGIFGPVSRPDKIVISGFDIHGKHVKIKAWGFLARVFQHEIDHLHGTLFIDKAKSLHQTENIESK
jgi:peptide deformylase